MKVLIVNPFGIGDVLFTTPLVASIKKAQPGAIISYWCNERVEPILTDNPHIDKIFALSRGDIKKIFSRSKLEGLRKFWGLVRSLKKERFDVCFDFSLDPRYGLITKLVGIKKRIGYDFKGRGKFLTHKKDIDGYNSKHIVQYYLDLLSFVGLAAGDEKIELFVPKAKMQWAAEYLRSRGLAEKEPKIAFCIGAGLSWGKDAAYKHWPARKFAELADKVTNGDKAKVVLLGDGLERDIADIVVHHMHNKALDLVGKLTLDQFIAVLSQVNIVVANDGGPLHMAVGLGLKTVSIFGPVDERVYGPYPPSNKHIVVKTDFACRPCYKNFRFPGCDKDRQCIEYISVDNLYTAIKSLS